jgi:hypothetical protein
VALTCLFVFAHVNRVSGEIVMYSLGNSLTAPLDAMDRLEGLTIGESPRNIELNRQIRSSTSISTFVARPRVDGSDYAVPLGTWDVAFSNNRLDVITLQPFYGPTIRQEAAAAAHVVNVLRGNPANETTRILILATWPSRVSGKTYREQWTATGQTLDSPFVPSARAYELFMDELRASVPEAELVPAGHVYYEINERGGVPGISSALDFYGDSIHPNNAGAYVESLATYSIIYGKSPVGLPYTSGFSNPLYGTMLDPAAVTPVQQITWDVTKPLAVVPEACCTHVGLAFIEALCAFQQRWRNHAKRTGHES